MYMRVYTRIGVYEEESPDEFMIRTYVRTMNIDTENMYSSEYDSPEYHDKKDCCFSFIVVRYENQNCPSRM